jgi:transcriptional regulator with XRE-family HTH domain
VSQRDVAAQLSAHQQFWSKIESGERRIDIVELSAVAPILGLNLNALLKRLREELDR